MPSDHDHVATSPQRLVLAIVLNLLITAVEIAGGLVSGSLALVSDALHNLSDSVSLLISLIAQRLSRKSYTLEKTFGFKRAEIMAALLNAVTLVAISFYLFIEAYRRFSSPEPINARVMIAVALFGLAANLLAVLLLHRDARGSLNIRSAYLHLLGDTFSSLAVVAGGMAILFANVVWLDPLLTVLIGLYVLKGGWAILREAIDILMQGTPPGIDIRRIQQWIESVPRVKNLHHVHVWRMDDRQVHFEGHVQLDGDPTLAEVDLIRRQIKDLLAAEFGVGHATIETESASCPENGLIRNGSCASD